MNELVVNGYVYDEKKAIFEFPHTLSAEVNGHRIEAGLDEDSFTFLRIDGETVVFQQRIV